MKFTLKTRTVTAELIIEADSTTITTDVSTCKNGEYIVDDETIEMFLSTVIDMARFNRRNADVMLTKKLIEMLDLRDSEIEEVLESLNEEKPS